MSLPHKALSALVCVVVAFMLGIVARLPALSERLQSPQQEVTYELPVGAGSTWGSANAVTTH